MNDEQIRQALLEGLPSEPEHCHNAYLSALRSVKEDEPVKRNIICTAAIAALLFLLTVGAALGAGQLIENALDPGFEDLAAQPDDANAMDAFVPVNEQFSWQIGPVTVTLIESVCDSKALWQTVRIRMTDGSKALFMPAGNSVHDHVSIMEGAAVWDTTGSMTFRQAARQANVPMYCITMISSFDSAIRYFQSPKFGEWEADGSLLLTSCIQLGSMPELTEARLNLRVYPIDVGTGKLDTSVEWQLTEIIPVCRSIPMRSYNYAPAQKTMLYTQCGDVRLCGVHLELMTSGAYLYAVYERTEATAAADLVPLIYTAGYTTLQGQVVPEPAAFMFDDASVGDLYITQQAVNLSEAPEALVMFDAGGILNSDPIVLRPVDCELSERYHDE